MFDLTEPYKWKAEHGFYLRKICISLNDLELPENSHKYTLICGQFLGSKIA